MKLSTQTENPNYLACFIELSKFSPIEGANKIKHAIINSNRVIVSADCKGGDRGVFFPIECQINKEFLSKNNLFSDKFSNADQSKVGFFDKHGRVRAVKLRGAVSEGFWIPLNAFQIAFGIPVAEWGSDALNQTFDTLKHEAQEILLCKKYIIPFQREGTLRNFERKIKKQESKILSGEYNFHYSTPKFQDNYFKLQPDQYISVSDKLHGTSFSMGRVKVWRNLSFWEKIKKFFGLKVELTEYSNEYASRTIIKSQSNAGSGYYDSNVWKIIFDRYKSVLKNDYQVFGEIVGFTPTGSGIQGKYDYGMEKGQCELFVYRVTEKQENGEIREFEFDEVVTFCNENGLKHVPIFYQGLAKNLFPELDVNSHWHQNFIDKLRNSFNLEKQCKICKNDVPAEGICIRVHGRDLPAFKLKSFKFLMKESKDLDAGVVDIESTESQ